MAAPPADPQFEQPRAHGAAGSRPLGPPPALSAPRAAAGGAAEGSIDPNPLLTLLRRCVVAIQAGDVFLGTGFFVAPGEVLTCAHVVHARSGLNVFWEGQTFATALVEALPDLAPDDERARSFYPFPDVALLRIDPKPDGHPCVALDLTDPVGGANSDVLYLDAWTRGERAGETMVRSSATLTYEGPVQEDEGRVLKLKGGQVVGGYSGGPLLNLRTLGVCALVDSSRHVGSDLGGFGVPISAFIRALPGLADRNRIHGSADDRWRVAREREIQVAAERAGNWPDLLDEAGTPLDWEPADSRSDLLRAAHAVVPLVGRQDLLDQLMLWREGDDPFGLVVLAGPAGYGKTRLAIEICRQAGRAGWTAGLLSVHDPEHAALGTHLAELARWPGRLLVAVDYAETRPTVVSSLLRRLSRRRGLPPARVVLVVRQGSARPELERTFATGDGRDAVAALLRQAELVCLDRQEHDIDRLELFEQARSAFAGLLGDGTPVGARPTLRAEHFARPLMVLAAALLNAEDPALDVDAFSADDLVDEILTRHEAQYWQRWDERLGVGIHESDRRLLVALGSLLTAATDDEATAIVRLAPAFSDASGERTLAVARWLGRLYGSGGVPTSVASLEPDTFAEALVAGELLARPDLLGSSLDVANDRQLTRALTVLLRASVVRREFADVCKGALDERLPHLVDRLAEQSGNDESLLAALHRAIILIRPVLGAMGAMLRLPEKGFAQMDLATDVTQLAVTGFREASNQNAGVFLPALAGSLNNLSLRLANLGRREDALAAIEEAVDVFRTLAATRPDAFLPDLAAALSNFSIDLGHLGRREDALAAIEEAVALRRTLVATRPDAFLPDLAGSLNNLSNCLADLGRHEDALAAIEEAVPLHRTLAAARPDAFLPDLAGSLNNLSLRLADFGRHEDALAAIERAVDAYRTLAATRPEAFISALAGSLIILSNRLVDFGRHEDALAAIKEAVDAYRILAAARPDAFLPALAGSLNNLALRLVDFGRHEDALAAIEEAVDAYRTLAATRPDAFLPDLAMSLNNLSLRLDDLGHSEDALAAIKEAVALRRTLVATRPDAFLPDLAGSLNNLSNCLADLGRHEDALALIEEAVDACRTLAAARPDAFLPHLVDSLHNLSLRLARVGRRREMEEWFGNVLADHAGNPWASGLLLLARSRWHLEVHLPSAIEDAIGAVDRLSSGRDPAARSEARGLLRLMRTRDSEAFDAAWSGLGMGDQPVWMRHPKLDEALVGLMVEWISTVSWDVSQAFLADHAQVVLTDRGEAALEHLIDANPGRGELVQHLSILQLARREGIAAAYRALDEQLRHQTLTNALVAWVDAPTWEAGRDLLAEHAEDLLTDEGERVLAALVEANPDHSGLLGHLGLLELSRLRGIDAAYAALGEIGARGPSTPESGAGDEALRVARARLHAGVRPDDPGACLEHAIAAVVAGSQAEAERAILRFADRSATWERSRAARELTAIADARPELAAAISKLELLLAGPQGP